MILNYRKTPGFSSFPDLVAVRRSFWVYCCILFLGSSLLQSNRIFATGQTTCDTVFANGFTDILTCYGDNPCTCFNCDTSDTDDLDVGAVLSCSELNQILCPQINCCSACSDTIQSLYQCIFLDAYANIPGSNLANCQIDCSETPFVDEVDPNCDPSDYQCIDLYTDYITCYAECSPTATCGADVDSGGSATTAASEQEIEQAIQDAALQDDECAVMNAIVCDGGDAGSGGIGIFDDGCCPECGTKLANFYQCQVNLDFEEPCTLECASATAPAGTNGNPTTPNQPSGGVGGVQPAASPMPDGSSSSSSPFSNQAGIYLIALVIAGGVSIFVV